MAVRVVSGPNVYNYLQATGWTISSSPRGTLSVSGEKGEQACFRSWDAVMIVDAKDCV